MIDPNLVNGNSITVTPTNGTGDHWQYQWPYQWWPYPQTVITTAPTDCYGDVHVFPCPHCNKCKCGGATKAKK